MHRIKLEVKVCQFGALFPDSHFSPFTTKLMHRSNNLNLYYSDWPECYDEFVNNPDSYNDTSQAEVPYGGAQVEFGFMNNPADSYNDTSQAGVLYAQADPQASILPNVVYSNTQQDFDSTQPGSAPACLDQAPEFANDRDVTTHFPDGYHLQPHGGTLGMSYESSSGAATPNDSFDDFYAENLPMSSIRLSTFRHRRQAARNPSGSLPYLIPGERFIHRMSRTVTPALANSIAPQPILPPQHIMPLSNHVQVGNTVQVSMSQDGAYGLPSISRTQVLDLAKRKVIKSYLTEDAAVFGDRVANVVSRALAESIAALGPTALMHQGIPTIQRSQITSTRNKFFKNLLKFAREYVACGYTLYATGATLPLAEYRTRVVSALIEDVDNPFAYLYAHMINPDGTITRSGHDELDHPAVMHTAIHVILVLGILEHLDNPKVQLTYLFALVGAIIKFTLGEQGHRLLIVTPNVTQAHIQNEFHHIINHIESMDDNRRLIFEGYKRMVVDCVESQRKSTGTL